MSRNRDVSIVTQNNGGVIAPFVAGKNRIINGDFGIWQRGTSFTNPANFNSGYTADRFFTANNASGATRVISRQTFSNSTSGLPVGFNNGSPQYFFRYDQQVAGTGGAYNLMEQRIEGIPFPNQTVTFSFWAKAAANLTLPQVDYEITYNGSNSSANIASNIAITTSWQRYSFTFTMPTITGTGTVNDFFGPRIWLPSNNTFIFDTWGWQLEAGNVATPFTTANGTIQQEFAACQRYYYKTYNQSTLPAASGTQVGYAATRTDANGEAWISVRLPVTMRSAPTIGTYSANNGTSGKANHASAGTEYTAYGESIGESGFSLVVIGVGASAVQVRTHFVASAEL